MRRWLQGGNRYDRNESWKPTSPGNEVLPPYTVFEVHNTYPLVGDVIQVKGGWFSGWVDDAGVYLVYESPMTKPYEKGKKYVWSQTSTYKYNRMQYSSEGGGGRIPAGLKHLIYKETDSDYHFKAPNGAIQMLSKSERHQDTSYIPWDIGNNRYNVKLTWIDTFLYSLAYAILPNWPALLVLGILLLWFLVRTLNNFNKQVNKPSGAGKHKSMWLKLFATSYILLILFGGEVGGAYHEFLNVVHVQSNVSHAFVERGYSVFPNFNYPTEPDVWLLWGVYMVSLLGLVVSTVFLIPLIRQFKHYHSTTHPASEEAVVHGVDPEHPLDVEEMADSLRADLGLSDPSWKIRSRTQQAKDLGELYKANADLGTKAEQHERDKHRKRNT